MEDLFFLENAFALHSLHWIRQLRSLSHSLSDFFSAWHHDLALAPRKIFFRPDF